MRWFEIPAALTIIVMVWILAISVYYMRKRR